MHIEPCPWCGCTTVATAEIESNVLDNFQVETGCGGTGPKCRSEEEAIRAWNKVARRLDPAAVLAALEAIERAFDEMTDTVDGLAFCGSVDAIQAGLGQIRALAGGE